MIRNRRIPQTLLLAGPEGVGKATLARRFAALLLGEAEERKGPGAHGPDNETTRDAARFARVKERKGPGGHELDDEPTRDTARFARVKERKGPGGHELDDEPTRDAARFARVKERIELDDLSLESNLTLIADREKWPADKRNEDPLFFASHPDFLTFAPDGPLRQLTIHQMRFLKDRATLKPLKGDWRVFLIDRIDRANEQAANSLLKTLEEPPPHLILIMTASNPYDLLPTIRSRSVPLRLGRLTDQEMRAFSDFRGLDHADKRRTLAEGSPGVAFSLDLDAYQQRRTAMLALL
jgi:DNA polymerase-3 subunit delta'